MPRPQRRNSGLAIPRLAGQRYEYLLRQMRDVLEGRRPDYSTEHLMVFNRLHPAQFASLADYLAHLDAARPKLPAPSRARTVGTDSTRRHEGNTAEAATIELMPLKRAIMLRYVTRLQ